jgi:hypothetical protein
MANKYLINSKEGQLKISMMLLLFLLVVAMFVTAQNLSEELISEKEGATDLCEDIECGGSNIECPDNFVMSCSNVCDSETGECSQCESDCEGHEAILLEEINETALEIPSIDEVNETVSEPEPSDLLSEQNLQSDPKISIEILHQDKITRDENVEVQAIITNSGAMARAVSVAWELPRDFEIISGNEIETCGDLDFEERCAITVEVQTSHLTSLGENQIKISVGYKNEI